MTTTPNQVLRQNDATLQDSVWRVMEGLPEPVQKFLSSQNRNQIVGVLSQKYRMHADQAGDFEHAFILLVLGLNTLQEFSAALAQTGIDPATTQLLIHDINEQVFEPLNEQMRNGKSTSIQSTQQKLEAPKQEWVEVTQKKPTVPPPAPSYTASPPPAPSVSVLHQTQPQGFQMHQAAPSVQVNVTLPGSIPPQPAPIPHVPTAPPVAPSQNYSFQGDNVSSPQQSELHQPGQTLYQPSQPEVPQVAAVRTMASDIEAVKSGHAPAAHLVPMHGVSDMGISERGQNIPPPMAQYPSSQKSAAPQPPQPVQPSQPQYTRPYIPSSTSRTPAPPPPRLPGSDPYREPFE